MSEKEIAELRPGIFDRFTESVMKLSDPLARFSQIPAVAAVQNGLTTVMPVIIIGSLFLIVAIFGMPVLGNSGQPLVPLLVPYVPLLNSVNSMTLGFVGFYAALTISCSYGEQLGLNTKQCGLIGLLTFLFISFKGTTNGAISVEYFGALGLFVAMVTSLCSVKLYKFLLDRKIVIKLPESVPPNVGNAFTVLIPLFVIITISWLIRSVLNVNLPAFMSNFLTPLLSAADSFGVFTIIMLITMILWSVGLNGPALLSAITTPIVTASLASNAQDKLAGVPLTHIWTETFNFSYIWIASIYPLLFLMLFSRSKGYKAISIASIPAAMFNIIEPIVFGLPMAMNIYLMIPFIISGTLGCSVAYLLTDIGFISRTFAGVPWATPPFISGILSTGDWKVLIVQVIVFILGLVIYFPFFRMFENIERRKQSSTECE